MANVPNLPAAGLLTGGRQAENYRTERQQDLANLESSRISNLKSAYEFQEYLDTRKYRDLSRRSKATQDQIDINTAPSRQAATDITNRVQARQGQTALNNEDAREQARRMQLIQQKEKIDQELGAVDREPFMAAQAMIQEIGPENIDEQTYGTIYNDTITRIAGRYGNPQEVANRLEAKFGLTSRPSVQNINIMSNIGTLAGHDAATWRAEHLARVKSYIEARYGNGASTTIKWNTDLMKATEDLFNARDEYGRRMSQGDTAGANMLHAQIGNLEERVDKIMSQDRYSTMELEQKQIMEDLKFMDGFQGDADPNPNLVPKYNQIMDIIKGQFPYHANNPAYLRRVFRSFYKYDPSGVWYGSKGNIVKKSPEEIIESMNQESAEQQYIMDVMTSSNTVGSMTEEQKDNARKGITEYQIKKQPSKVRGSRGQR